MWAVCSNIDEFSYRNILVIHFKLLLILKERVNSVCKEHSLVLFFMRRKQTRPQGSGRPSGEIARLCQHSPQPTNRLKALSEQPAAHQQTEGTASTARSPFIDSRICQHSPQLSNKLKTLSSQSAAYQQAQDSGTPARIPPTNSAYSTYTAMENHSFRAQTKNNKITLK